MLLYPMRTPYNELLRFLKIKLIKSNNFPSNLFSCFKYNNFFVTIKWGASSRWSSRPNPAYGSLQTTAIGKTHPTLILFWCPFTSLQTLTASSSGSFTIEQLDGIWVDSHWSLALLRTILWHFDATAGFFWSVKGWDNSPMAIFISISVWRRKIIRFPIFAQPEFDFGRFFLFQLDISNRRSSLLREVPRIWVFSLFFEIRFSRPLVVKKGGEKKGILESGEKEKTRPIDKTKTQGTLGIEMNQTDEKNRTISPILRTLLHHVAKIQFTKI